MLASKSGMGFCSPAMPTSWPLTGKLNEMFKKDAAWLAQLVKGEFSAARRTCLEDLAIAFGGSPSLSLLVGSVCGPKAKYETQDELFAAYAAQVAATSDVAMPTSCARFEATAKAAYAEAAAAVLWNGKATACASAGVGIGGVVVAVGVLVGLAMAGI